MIPSEQKSQEFRGVVIQTVTERWLWNLMTVSSFPLFNVIWFN